MFYYFFRTFGHIFGDENTDTLLVNDAVNDDLEEIDVIDLNILNDENHDLPNVLPKHHRWLCTHNKFNSNNGI